MRALDSIQAKHVYRKANCVAHRLAHIVSCSNLDDFWIDKTSSIIKYVLYENMCHVARGT
jgi:hypothetical protein